MLPGVYFKPISLWLIQSPRWQYHRTSRLQLRSGAAGRHGISIGVVLRQPDPAAIFLIRMFPIVYRMPCAVWFSVLACTTVMAQTKAEAPAVLEQIRSHNKGIALWWVGNAGWVLKADNLLIGIDLDLSTSGKIQPPVVTPEQLAGEL